MTTGTIKKWTDSGWGFIRCDDGQPDVFAHAKFFADVVEPLHGMRVRFEIVHDEQSNKMRADRIEVM